VLIFLPSGLLGRPKSRRSERGDAAPLGSRRDTRPLGEQRELEAWREAHRARPRAADEAPAALGRELRFRTRRLPAASPRRSGLFFLGPDHGCRAGPLSVRQRWGALVIAVAIVFGVRLLLNLLVYKKPQSAVGLQAALGASPRFSGIGKLLGRVLLSSRSSCPSC
jgi:hypothetical protein